MESELNFDEVLAYINNRVEEYRGQPLNQVETQILQFTWYDLSYELMAERMGYAASTLQKVYGFKLWPMLSKALSIREKFNKSRFKQVVTQCYQSWTQEQSRISVVDSVTFSTSVKNVPVQSSLTRIVDAVKSGCHSLVLTGVKGVGKSHLLKSIKPQLKDQFFRIIHHSSHETPTWQTCYQQLFPLDTASVLSDQQIRQQVLQTFTKQPYLMVIDQGERFLDDPKHRDFIRDVTTISNHQSCFVWSGAVIPSEIEKHSILIETIKGLSFDETKRLLVDYYPDLAASLTTKEHHWRQLNDLCGGNPRLLHQSMEAIQFLYNNQIEQFQPLPLLPSLSNYFEELLADLSEPEQTLLYWLAIQPLSWLRLMKWPLWLPFEETILLDAGYMLQRRHLIKQSDNGDGLWHITPRYLGLYLLHKLQAIFVQELLDERLHLFHSYPIGIPTASLEQQKTLHAYLLKPVANGLRKKLSLKSLQAKICRLLSHSSEFCEPSSSSAAGNLFNLAVYMGIAVADIDWSQQTLWHLDLRVDGIKGVDFRGCRFKDVAITTGLQGDLVTVLHPRGKSLAVGDGQGILQVYQWTDSRFVLNWCYDVESPIQEIVITQNNRLVVTTLGQSIYLWDTLTDKEVCEWTQLEQDTLNSIAIREDGELLATGFSDGTIQLWDLAWGIEKKDETLSDNNDIGQQLIFSPDGKYLAGYGNDHQISIWHLDAVTNVYRAAVPLPLNPYGELLDLQWTETHLNAVEAVLDPNSQEYRSKLEIRAFMVDEDTLVDDSIHIDVQALSYRSGQPQHAVFSSDGSYIALCDRDHMLYLWHGLSLMSDRKLKLSTLPYALNICNGGRLLLCRETDRLSLWDLAKQECLQVWDSVSDLDQYKGCKFSDNQGLSNDELATVQRLGAILCE